VPFSRKKYSVKLATDDWGVAAPEAWKYLFFHSRIRKYLPRRASSGDLTIIPRSSVLNGFVM